MNYLQVVQVFSRIPGGSIFHRRQHLSVLAYNFKRVLSILGFERTKKAMQMLGA
jgi:hypothetical protein